MNINCRNIETILNESLVSIKTVIINCNNKCELIRES